MKYTSKATQFLLMFSMFTAMLVPCAMAGQVVKSQATVNLSMNVPESLTLTPSTQNLPAFVYTAATNSAAPQTFAVTINYNLVPGNHVKLSTNWYFSSPTSAMNAGTSLIPAADVFSNVGAGTYMACNANPDPVDPDGVAGATCNAGDSIANPTTGTKTLTIGVELQNLPANLAPGSYAGVLNIESAVN